MEIVLDHNLHAQMKAASAAGHALAYPLGTLLGLPHGLANAIIFPHVLAFNQNVVPEKTAEVSAALGLSGDDLLPEAHDFCARLGIEMRLSAHGATEDQLTRFATDAHAIRRLMDDNPRNMSVNEALSIYRAAFSESIYLPRLRSQRAVSASVTNAVASFPRNEAAMTRRLWVPPEAMMRVSTFL